MYRRGNQQISVAQASGAIEYINRSIFAKDLGKIADFSDEEAVGFAKEHARKLDLIPLNECQLLRVNRLTMGNGNLATRDFTSRVVNVAVVFQRIVNQIPVEGPGGKLAVFLDASADLCGATRVWRNIALEGMIHEEALQPEKFKMNLHPSTFAKDVFTRRFHLIDHGNIEVTKQKFGYWEMGPDEQQKYLQPVYVVHFDNIGPGGTIRKGIHVVPAGTTPLPGLDFIKSSPEVQPPRRS